MLMQRYSPTIHVHGEDPCGSAAPPQTSLKRQAAAMYETTSSNTPAVGPTGLAQFDREQAKLESTTSLSSHQFLSVPTRFSTQFQGEAKGSRSHEQEAKPVSLLGSMLPPTMTMSHQPKDAFLQSNTASGTTSEVGTFDVLSTRTKQAFQHPGNIYFRQLIRTYRPEYQESNTRKVKIAVAEEIVQLVYRAGGRFLKKTGGAWRAMNDEEAHAKVGHALRSAKATQSPFDSLIHRLHIPSDGGPPSVLPESAQSQSIFPMRPPRQQQRWSMPALPKEVSRVQSLEGVGLPPPPLQQQQQHHHHQRQPQQARMAAPVPPPPMPPLMSATSSAFLAAISLTQAISIPLSDLDVTEDLEPMPMNRGFSWFHQQQQQP